MKLLRSVILVTAVILLVGCAQTFVRPTTGAIKVGHSTRDEVIKVAGSPSLTRESVNVNGETIQVVMYLYSEPAKFVGLIGIGPQRALTYSFFKNVLIGEEYNSSFSEESTNFETKKIPSIVKGKSTRAEVIAALGKPAGEVLYPIVKDKNGNGIVYEYDETLYTGFGELRTSLVAVISFDENNIVSEISYKKSGVEQM